MLRTLAKSMLIGAAQRRVGVMPAGTISTALLTTGASLMLKRGRRPIGLALVAAGGVLLWHEAERSRAVAEPEKAGVETKPAS
ncbi:hypothetical protein [Sphingomonas oligoaromativorans]|uniref:hypothetical protein n=1 Tax=Sphingomonas oligoaromativorans TaxID=575322 RepID=UPI00141F814B|nr:hypothetical protein [Sphingomonas oligoaromativorans]NIJ32863.1 hypothetical protein [Sphingomonas oligoaromativorans]